MLAKIVFLFDRVMHYHRALFERLDKELQYHGHEMILMSGKEKASTTGRVALRKRIARNQVEFSLYERSIGSFTLRYQGGVVDTINALRPAVVVTTCHSGTFSEWLIARSKKKLGFKLVAWQCGYEFNPGRLKQWVLGKFVPQFDHHLAYHTNAKHYALAHGARLDQITVMHNTINEAAIACIPKDEAQDIVAQRWPAVADKKIVLYVGAILEEKRLEVILEALSLLNRPDTIFLMVGDGPHLATLKELYGARSDFVSTGQIVDGVGPYFDAAQVYLLPGTGGLGINEAMAHGLPIISGFADGSADDLVVDGENGYRLRDGTKEEMADRIARVLDHPDMARQMGETSRKWITGKFAFSNFIERIKSVLLAGA